MNRNLFFFCLVLFSGVASAEKSPAPAPMFTWEFSIRDKDGKSLRKAQMAAEGTAALRDKERGSCMYKFLKKEPGPNGSWSYIAEETCALAAEMARGNATVSSTKQYSCVVGGDVSAGSAVQSCASTVDTRTGKQFHCECIKLPPLAAPRL